MGRVADPNSVRQRGLQILEGMRDYKREDAILVLMDTFDIDEPYAATIHATRRTIDKKKGLLVPLYSVEDQKDGRKVKPYIKKVIGYKMYKDRHQRLTPAGAVSAYLKDLENKIDFVEKNLTLG